MFIKLYASLNRFTKIDVGKLLAAHFNWTNILYDNTVPYKLISVFDDALINMDINRDTKDKE
jgi:hypothetical protein